MLRESIAFGVRDAVVVSAPSGLAIREYDSYPGAMRIQHAICYQPGTLAAVSMLLELIDGPLILATCDLYGPAGALASWLNEAVGRGADMVIGVSEYAGEAQPIWVAGASGGTVTGYGKSIAQGQYRATGVRLIKKSLGETLHEILLEGRVATDTDLTGALIADCGVTCDMVECVGIFDVDTPEELIRARSMLHREWEG